MAADDRGLAELRRARAGSLPVLAMVAIFSLAVNILMLTGPLFMLQVYDRVLGSRSVETLVALSLLVAFLFLIMGVVDLARSRIMQRVALRFQDRLEQRVFAAALEDGIATGSDAVARGGMRDLEAVRNLIASPVSLAMFDLPFAPLYLAAVYIFHPVLGVVATIGGLAKPVACVDRILLDATTKCRQSSHKAHGARIVTTHSILEERNSGHVVAALERGNVRRSSLVLTGQVIAKKIIQKAHIPYSFPCENAREEASWADSA